MPNEAVSNNVSLKPVSKSKLGLVAFTLCILGFLTISYSFNLIAPLTAILSIIAIKRKSYVVLSIISLVLSAIWLVLILMLNNFFITLLLMRYTPSEGPVNSRSLYLYRFVAPEGDFWLSYDQGKLSRIFYKMYWGQGSAGALYFTSSDSDVSQREKLITLAQSNGWQYEKDLHYTSDFITTHLNDTGHLVPESKDYDTPDDLLFCSLLCYCPVWIRSDCTVLCFSKEGYRTYVVLPPTGKEMAIYCDLRE